MDLIEKAVTPGFLTRLLGKPVEKVSVSMGSNVGDNYMCVIYGIQAQLPSGETYHLIIKAYPTLDLRQQMLKITNIFAKEYHVYHYWFSEFAKLQESAGKKDMFTLGVPKFIAGAAVDYLDPNGTNACSSIEELPVGLENYLLMEDARKHGGFKMADRMKGLDAAHARLIMKELGKFHALGWGFKLKHGYDDLVKEYPYLHESFMNEELMETFQGAFKIMVDTAKQMITSSFGEEAEITKRFTELLSDEDRTVQIMKKYLAGIDVDEVQQYRRTQIELPADFVKDTWKTTCHGDCWVNNFLFSYKENSEGEPKVDKAILLDFQLMRDACPTTDLNYFLYTSVNGKIRRENLDDFLKVYHDSFISVCDALGYEPLPGFSFESLKIRFRLTNVYGLMIAIPLLFAVLKKAEGAEDLDKLDAKDMGEVFSKGMGFEDENSVLKERLAEVVEEMFQDGAL